MTHFAAKFEKNIAKYTTEMSVFKKFGGKKKLTA